MSGGTLKAETRAPGVLRVNRVLLLLLGLLLLAAGLAGGAASLGLLPAPDSAAHVLDAGVDRVAGWTWFAWAVAGGGLLLALLCLWWLLAQARSDRLGTVRLARSAEHGNTTLRAGALTDALTAEVEGYRGVQRSSAHLTGTTSSPALTLTAQLDGRVPVAAVRDRISAEALVHARQALGVDALPTRLELSVPRRSARDVR